MITSSHDRTCDYLISKFKNVIFFRFNMDMFSSYQVAISASSFSIKNQYREVNSENCKSIYLRKPIPEELKGVYEEKYHLFSYKESYALIEGLVEYFPGRCLSKPSTMRRAGNKILQALIANEIGFKIPELAITNDPETVARITQEKSIVKPISIGTVFDRNQKEFVQTNLFDASNDLSLLKFTPAYFQHYFKKDYEVRVTFVGRKSFPARIDSRDTIDWRRPGNEIQYSTCSIPNNIYRNCISLLEKTNIDFGCFDFIVSNGEWYFLEMNANGQWAWLEFETGMNISGAIIDYLSE